MRLAGGASSSPDATFAAVYTELRAIARRERRRNPASTLNTTAIVHEAWLKLNGKTAGRRNRSHYLATAALAMRQILVDYARYRGAHKRAAPQQAVPDVKPGEQNDALEQIIAVDHALDRLQKLDERLARLVELRFFAGLPLDEAADCLGISLRTAARDWQKARAFLQTELRS